MRRSTEAVLSRPPLLLFAGALILCGTPRPAFAAPTLAGTTITNTATARYDLPSGGSGTVSSNTVSLRVDELLDVAVASLDSGDVVGSAGATNQVLTFRLTNAGNGSEAFALLAQDNVTGDNFDPSTTSIAIDSNGNGVYDPGTDIVYVAGSNDPVLAPDATVTIFVLSTLPAGAANGDRGRVNLVANAVTGTGTAGTIFSGAGQGGGDAVVGATTARATGQGTYAVRAASVTFVKSAVVVDPFGGTTQIPGSTITYSLLATVTGSGTLNNLVVSDTVPTGTAYLPGTITLGGAALSDIVDGDAGEMISSALAVRLGNAPAGSSYLVKFQVKVN